MNRLISLSLGIFQVNFLLPSFSNLLRTIFFFLLLRNFLYFIFARLFFCLSMPFLFNHNWNSFAFAATRYRKISSTLPSFLCCFKSNLITCTKQKCFFYSNPNSHNILFLSACCVLYDGERGSSFYFLVLSLFSVVRLLRSYEIQRLRKMPKFLFESHTFLVVFFTFFRFSSVFSFLLLLLSFGGLPLKIFTHTGFQLENTKNFFLFAM